MTINETPTAPGAQDFAAQVAHMLDTTPGEVQAGPGSRLVMLDPGTLVVGANARADVTLGREFVASIKDHGVLQPIVAVRDGDGAVVVRLGQRRTLAAVQVGLDSVPVWVIEATSDEAERIVEQLVENDHRDAMTDRDRVAAVEQLSMLGMSAAKIAKRTHRPGDEVKAALKVAKSAAARAALTGTGDGAEHAAPLTLAQAAMLAEFDDDEADLARIMAEVEAGRSGEHVAQQIRDRRTCAKERATAERAARADGLTVVQQYEHTDLTDLVDADGEPLTGHQTCPGHAVYVWMPFDCVGGSATGSGSRP